MLLLVLSFERIVDSGGMDANAVVVLLLLGGPPSFMASSSGTVSTVAKGRIEWIVVVESEAVVDPTAVLKRGVCI